MRFSRRAADVCSWVCLALTLIAWVMGYPVFHNLSWPGTFWAMVALRIGSVPLLGDSLGPCISRYSDRVVWIAIVLAPAIVADWSGVLIAGALWLAWAGIASLGRYWDAQTASNAEGARAAQLEALECFNAPRRHRRDPIAQSPSIVGDHPAEHLLKALTSEP
jgi:hypothetical protein